MKINKNLVLGALTILIIGCRENTSKQDSRNLKNNHKVDSSNPSDTKETKNIINKSFVISCGSGCAMTYTAESIQSEAPTIKVKFKVEMYLNEKVSDTYYEVYIFKYDTSNNIIKIQPEGKNENVLENLLPDAQESFKKFSIDLIKDKHLEIKSSDTCIEESKIKLRYDSVRISKKVKKIDSWNFSPTPTERLKIVLYDPIISNEEEGYFNYGFLVIAGGQYKVETQNIVRLAKKNSPYSAFEKIVFKNNFFTIEQHGNNSDYSTYEYLTFKYENKVFYLHQYSIEYTSKNNPDENIPSKKWFKKDFGIVKLENVSPTFLENLQSK